MSKGLPTVTRHKISRILSENARIPSTISSTDKEYELKLPYIDLSTTKSGSATALHFSVLENEKAKMNFCKLFLSLSSFPPKQMY